MSRIPEPEEFCHLHTHSSQGSFLDGASSPLELAVKTKQNRSRFLTLTEHGQLSSIPSQIRASEHVGLEPIFGIESYLQRIPPVKEITDLEPEVRKIYRKSYHVLLLVYNEIGYQNLVTLISHAHINSLYNGRARISFEMLKKLKEGLIITSTCIMSEIGQKFVNFGAEAAEEVVIEYHNTFQECFFLELMMLDFKLQKPYDIFLISMSKRYNIPVIFTGDCHYCNAEDSDSQTNLLLVQSKKTRLDLQKLIDSGDTNVFEVQDKQLYLKSVPEILHFWNNTEYKQIIPEDILYDAMRNTVKIAEKCKGVKIDRSVKLPEIADADLKLLEEIKKGFKKRGLPNTQEYKRRIIEEYDLITRKGFSSYFLIQKQIIDAARNYSSEILGFPASAAINPGRGSAAGCLILYLLGVTDVNPIPHDLLFSRFLSESRGRILDYHFDDDVFDYKKFKESP